MRALWVVIEHDYDSATIHCAFEHESDAKAYADQIGASGEEIRVYGAGQMPLLTEGWTAEARAGGLPYPPELTRHVWSEYQHTPTWAKQPCELVDCSMRGRDLYLWYRGSDRDAVLAACQRRYDKALGFLADDSPDPAPAETRLRPAAVEPEAPSSG